MSSAACARMFSSDAVRVHQLLRGLLADALHARHVVRRVADEREIVGDARGRHAESLAAVLDAHPLFFDARRSAAAGVQQPDAGTHELLKVLVARDDDDVHARLDALPRERADDVVGFIALQCENWNAIRVEDGADALHAAIEVGLQLVGQLLARRLVGGIALVAKRQCRSRAPSRGSRACASATRRWRKLTTPQAADVFSPRLVVSGRAMSAKNAR